MNHETLTAFLSAFAKLPLERQTMLAMIFRIMDDANRCIDSFAIVTELTPDKPPRDVEHLRVAKHRLIKLAKGVFAGSVDGAEYSRVMGELIEYVEREHGEAVN